MCSSSATVLSTVPTLSAVVRSSSASFRASSQGFPRARSLSSLPPRPSSLRLQVFNHSLYLLILIPGFLDESVSLIIGQLRRVCWSRRLLQSSPLGLETCCQICCCFERFFFLLSVHFLSSGWRSRGEYPSYPHSPRGEYPSYPHSQSLPYARRPLHIRCSRCQASTAIPLIAHALACSDVPISILGCKVSSSEQSKEAAIFDSVL